MRIPVGQRNYPTRWSDIEAILRAQRNTAAFGLTCSPGTLHRFGARYRLARSVERVELSDGYSAPIIAGYTELFRAFLMYTALEQWARAKGCAKVWQLRIDYDKFDNDGYVGRVRQCEGYTGVISFLAEFADAGLRQGLQAFYGRGSAKMIHVAAAVRHIFAHGIFSSSSGTTDTNTAVISVCGLAHQFTLAVVDGLYIDTVSAALDEVDRENTEWLEFSQSFT